MDAYFPLAAYLGGLAATLVLACYLTPARWWHRPTLRNLGVVAVGTWTIGALMLQAVGGKASAKAAPETAPQAAAIASGTTNPQAAPRAEAAGMPFRVHRDLNLRVAAGTNAAWLATIPAGTMVTPTGARNGDWWQVRAETHGRTQTGWASSLWLRRQAE